jgi:hypothetical protein
VAAILQQRLTNACQPARKVIAVFDIVNPVLRLAAVILFGCEVEVKQ